MRVNVYAEEVTKRVEIKTETIDGATFTGLRFYLELPATVDGKQYKGPFMHRPGDDDSAAVTFWSKGGKAGLIELLNEAHSKLAAYQEPTTQPKSDYKPESLQIGFGAMVPPAGVMPGVGKTIIEKG